MRPEQKTPRQIPGIKVFLDGQPVVLPEASMDTFSSLRAQLEVIALRQNRVLSDLSLDGMAVKSDLDRVPLEGIHQVQAQTISFQELGTQMAQTALRQVKQIEAHTEEAMTRVLINESTMAWDLVRGLDSEIRPLLVLVTFLQELRGGSLFEHGIDPVLFAQHLTKLQNIRAAWSSLELRGDVGALSDLIEQQMLPWVAQLGVYLRQIHEK